MKQHKPTQHQDRSSKQLSLGDGSKDLFTDYESGLERLETAVKNDPIAHKDLSVLVQRLHENINNSRRYGDTKDRKSERSEIIDNLNTFAFRVTQKNFAEWCHSSPKDETPLKNQSPRRFEKISLEAIPAPAHLLPSGSRMKLFHNPLFIGRDEELKMLAQAINSTREAIVITGMPGIGKTQLAVEFSWRYGRYFPDGLFWLDFENKSRIPTEIAECGNENHLHLPNFDGLALEKQVEKVLEEFTQDKSRLLIFDNCEDEQLFQEWKHKVTGCRVLVTTRIGDWNPYFAAEVFQLKVLTQESSVNLLVKLTQSNDTKNLQQIAKELGHLTLALHLAGSYLFQYKYTITPAQFLNDLLSGPPIFENPTLTEFNTIGQVFTIIKNKLDLSNKVDIAALNLLSQAARFAVGEPIPPILLRVSANGSHLTNQKQQDSNHSKYDPFLTSKGIRRLVNLGLLERSTNTTLRIHRLLADFVKEDASQIEAQIATDRAILDAIHSLSREKTLLNTLHFLYKHLRAVAEKAPRKDSRESINLYSWLGYYLNELSDYSSALTYYKHSLEIAKRLLGQQHLFCFRCLTRIGEIQQTIELLDKSQKTYHEALEIAENVLGMRHPRTISIIKRLAVIYREVGDLENAHTYCQQSLKLTEIVLGIEHPNTISSLDEIAYVLSMMGRKEESFRFYKRALDTTKKIHGSNYPRLLFYFQTIGTLLREIKDVEGAREYFLEAIEIQKVIFGSNHISIASNLSSIGATFRAVRNYEEAYTYFRHALYIREKVLGEEHPDTIQSLNDFGYIRWLMGELDAAFLFYNRVFYLQEKIRGIEDIDTVQSLNNLISLLRAKGDGAEATKIVKQKLEILEQRVGLENPSTQRVQDMLK